MVNTGGGCLGKVDSDRLLRMLRSSGREVVSRADFLDTEVLQLARPIKELVTSVDLVFDLDIGSYDLGWIAAIHAVSDLFAALAQPLTGTVSMGVLPSQIADDFAGRALAGVTAGLESVGASFGGGHTVFADRAFLSVSITGTHRGVVSPTVPDRRDYELLISKPLGTGIYLAANQHGLLKKSAREEMIRWMKASNQGAAHCLSIALERDEDAVGFVTDVTGFGFTLALHSRLPPGFRAEVSAGDVPLLAETIDLIQFQGLSTALGDRNSIALDDDTTVEIEDVDGNILQALHDPQTSGGLLAAVDPRVASELIAERKCSWTKVGTLTPIAEGQSELSIFP